MKATRPYFRGSAPEPALAADREIPLLVLRRSLGELQHTVLCVARSAGRLGVPVHAVRLRTREPATRSRYLSGALELSTGSDARQWVESLMALGSRFDGSILLPTDDLAAVTVGDHQEMLAERFRLPAQPAGIQRRLASKLALMEICDEFGLPRPAGEVPASSREAIDHAKALGYPVVLKLIAPWTKLDAPSVALVHEQGDLVRAYERMQDSTGGNVLVQEFIPGGTDSVWMFNGYFDGSSRCLCGFTGQKLRQGGGVTGPTSLGVCSRNDTVLGLAQQLMRGLQYRGIVDMGFRFDARDSTYKLLDVNPRLGSTFRLFVSPNGLDVVRALHLDLTDRRVPESSIEDGRRWLDEPHDVVSSLSLARRGQLSGRGWLTSLRGVAETAWWAVDDLEPFLAMSLQLPSHAIGKSRGDRQAVDAGPVPAGVS